MKTIIEFINEKQNFLIKGHTKTQKIEDLKQLASKMLEVGLCDKPKEDYFSIITILTYNNETGNIHIYPDGINNDVKVLTDEDCKKEINVAEKEPKIYFTPSESILKPLEEFLKKYYPHTGKFYNMGHKPEVYINIDSLNEAYVVLNHLIQFALKK